MCFKQCHKFNAFLSKFDSLVFLVVRLCLGGIFLMAGYEKFFTLDQVAGHFAAMGIPLADLQAPFVAGAEFVCGILLILGLWSRYASLLLVVIMAVALSVAHGAELTDVFAAVSHKVSLIILLLLVLATKGAGSWSVDAFSEKKNL